MKNTELEQLINDKLNSAAISDYAPNGLQVEGKDTVCCITGIASSLRSYFYIFLTFSASFLTPF